MLWLDWLACESIDCAACIRMLLRVKFAISSAMSTSRMVDSAAFTFTTALFRLRVV